MINQLVRGIVHSPLYPHWLENRKKHQADHLLLTRLRGQVLEVGAGDGSRKQELLSNHASIKRYIATDFSEWDSEFSKIDALVRRAGPFGRTVQTILGYQERAKLDKVCDAMKLPFKNNSFDYHLSFETIEHIADPDRYFREAARVIKKGGHIYVSVPFLYRMHGGEPDHKWDYHRYAFGFFHRVAEKYGLKVEKLYSNTGFGTTWATLTNQFLIRRLFEGTWLTKVVVILCAPFLFVITNSIGFLIDLKPDIRFATRFHVLLKKK